jgi:hypothetical protein
MKTIMEDSRPISGLCILDPHGSGWFVGRGDITSIVPYEESGQMSYIVWFAVLVGDVVKFRIPASAVYVEYFDEN